MDALAGNAKLCLIATISPALKSIEESVSTLEFVRRCAAVRNQAVVNEIVTEDVGELHHGVQRLRSALKVMQARLERSTEVGEGFVHRKSSSKDAGGKSPVRDQAEARSPNRLGETVGRKRTDAKTQTDMVVPDDQVDVPSSDRSGEESGVQRRDADPEHERELTEKVESVDRREKALNKEKQKKIGDGVRSAKVVGTKLHKIKSSGESERTGSGPGLGTLKRFHTTLGNRDATAPSVEGANNGTSVTRCKEHRSKETKDESKTRGSNVDGEAAGLKGEDEVETLMHASVVSVHGGRGSKVAASPPKSSKKSTERQSGARSNETELGVSASHASGNSARLKKTTAKMETKTDRVYDKMTVKDDDSWIRKLRQR